VLAELQRHPHAHAVLGPALSGEGAPSHAYLFHGPGGAGKRAAARAIAAELLAEGSQEPEGAKARALSGNHPDLTWIAPSGAHEILVSDIDRPLVASASKTPFESQRRVFVIERVDELGDEAANRMLKTLEEPAAFVHMILLTERLAEVLPTIASRCQLVRFDAPSIEEVAADIERGGVPPQTAVACARLSLGDAGQARELATPQGARLRSAAEEFARAAVAGRAEETRPWVALLSAVRSQGDAARQQLEERAEEELELYPRKERKRVETEWTERIRRSRRRVETKALDLGLQLVSLWFEDLAFLSWDAGDLVRHTDRGDELESDAGIEASRLRQAIDLVEDTRQRFQLNVSEDLACEALAYRLETALGS